ncbi:DNA repair protein RAD51 homolog 2-like isoform X2 [Homarus americanus]|uniref:DNA repair protein RAD51 homolog 2-like isoform X2 n=1 Tax=Homarus americanus TaxID=6706 RepID=UPI001C441FDF|nr:DNA repair protein RAD51 homolog 2-like isoform X2 [Homarus americanus]
MTFQRLSKLALDEDLKTRLSRSPLKTVKDVLSLSPLEVMNLLHMSAAECKLFMDHLYNVCVPKHLTAFDLSQDEDKNSFRLGNTVLDTLLHGGLQSGTLTEFAGSAGAGKTQWCLYLAVLAVTPKKHRSRNITAIYIDTESAFRPERIVEIISSKYPELTSNISKYLSMINLYQPKTISSLNDILESLEVIAVEKDVGVVIVDSVASLARKEIMCDSSQSIIARTNQLASWAAKLKCIAQQLNICVVVTNQVTTRLVKEAPQVTEEMQGVDGEEDELNTGSRERTFSYHVIPALGNTWTHCVTTRLILQFTNSEVRQTVRDSILIRDQIQVFIK